MDPIIISDTRQDFNGRAYYGTEVGYFVNNFEGYNGRLHRVVYAAANGPIPKGCHIHHKNGIKSDNRLENLECISAKDHAREHHLGHSHPLSEAALTAAAEWHRSEEGRAWHRAHARTPKAKQELQCVQCGAKYIGAWTFRQMCGQVCRKRHDKGLIGGKGGAMYW